MTPESVDLIAPYLDANNIDLKGSLWISFLLEIASS
jgi:hypothetical protein